MRSRASTVFNGQVTYRLAPWARLSFDAFNLLDARVDDIAYFYTSRLRGEPVGGVQDIHFHPAESRSVRTTATLEY